jgi:hypothetical protein
VSPANPQRKQEKCVLGLAECELDALNALYAALTLLVALTYFARMHRIRLMAILLYVGFLPDFDCIAAL